ncbi:uncharacterized protein JCM6883_007348 [Sporobolomyces salmoneus]|uniref:uncharacterized protein n=1 Tax=Sporobolomyces salmoneus TaxID=183962 RepID=UPI003179F5D0
MDPEFAIAPPEASTVPVEGGGGGEQRLSNKEKRKLKQLEKQQELAQQQAQQAEEAAAAIEETPLSHKEKRQAKKRRLALEAAGEDPDSVEHAQAGKKKGTAAAGGAPGATTLMIGGTAVGNTPARSAHGVWVGNMNFATHARDLLAWFQARGLSDITRINMPNGKRSHENNRGFAYLDFPTETDVVVAVGLSEQNLDGRKLLIKASTDYTGRPAPSIATLPPLDPSALEPSEPSTSTSTAASGTGTTAPPQTLNRTARKILNRQKNPAGPTLFIGNLGFETVVDDIRDMFDRNQKRSREWEKKAKGEKKKKSSKGKKKREEGQDEDEDESEIESEAEEEDGSSSSEEEESEEEDAEEEMVDDDDADLTAKKPRKEKREKKEKGPLDLTKAETAGIRKVRLGTFEDTGKCKGWAFVDFHLPAQATRALLNLHNHSLNGRSLNVEYASAEAVRRGGLGTRAVSKANGAARARGGDEDDARPARGGGEKRKGRDWDDSDMVAAATAATSGGFYDGPPAARRAPRGDGFGGDRPRREERPGKGGKGGERAKPGAALAMAQRASEAIVQSTGRKTTFE